MAARRAAPTAGDQVYEALRTGLRRQGATGVSWTGTDGDTTIEHIARAAEWALQERLRELDVREVAGWAASAMAVAGDDRFRARTTPMQTLATARLTQTHTENATAAQVILELAARQPVEESRRAPSQRDLEALTILAHELWRWRTVADRVASGLVSVASARLTRRGRFEANVTDRPPLRWSRYEAAYLRRMADVAPGRAPQDESLIDALTLSMNTGIDVPEELREIDRALRTDRGHGLVDLLVVQELLTLLAGSDDDGVAGYAFRDGMVGIDEAISDNIPRLAPWVAVEAARAAGRGLIWTQELLQQTPLQLSEFREAPARLYSRPILEFSDGSLFVPRNAAGFARLVLIQRVLEGTWPEALGSSDRTLARALDRRRQRVRPVLGFEAELEHVLASTGLPHVTSVGTSPVRPSPMLGVPVRAELDAVVLVPWTNTIWVVEAKDLAIPFSPRRVRSELDKYLRPGGHVAKLDEKVAGVAVSPTDVSRCLGYKGGASEFLVRGVFVTRELTPAAFVGAGHEFVTLDRLPSLLLRR